LQLAFPDLLHAVVAIPDPKKGEQLVMFTTMPKPDRKQISDGLKAQGASDLMIPKLIEPIAEMPLLGSGKTDHVSLLRMAKEKHGA
jgi:acyl-[acyl-carrier-protein]-phospholipid O-acyltransferase/long-chain-fatty-acid--[acyl-carrier-protein] ligase